MNQSVDVVVIILVAVIILVLLGVVAGGLFFVSSSPVPATVSVTSTPSPVPAPGAILTKTYPYYDGKEESFQTLLDANNFVGVVEAFDNMDIVFKEIPETQGKYNKVMKAWNLSLQEKLKDPSISDKTKEVLTTLIARSSIDEEAESPAPGE